MDKFFLFEETRTYDQGDVYGHLKYLQDYGGTPDAKCSHESLVAVCGHVPHVEGACVITDADFKVLHVTDADTKL